MYTVTFFLPGLNRLHAITTPNPVVARIVASALQSWGYAVRVWHLQRLV